MKKTFSIFLSVAFISQASVGLCQSERENLTFYAQYEAKQPGAVPSSTLDADYSSGAATATFTASRSSTTPATYVDENGVIQLVTESNTGRITSGFYDSTGFVSRPGILIDVASTNYMRDSYMHRDDNADGLANTWSKSWGTATRVAAPELSSITDFYWQRLQYTFLDTESNYTSAFNQSTANDTFASGDTFTLSFWVKGTSSISSGKTFQFFVNGKQNDNTYTETRAVDNVTLNNCNFTTPVRISVTGTFSNALTKKAQVIIGEIGADNPSAGDSYDLYITGVQLEKLPFASSFIPTTTAVLTRNAETLTYPISGNRTAATESLFIKLTPLLSGSQLNDYPWLTQTDTKIRGIQANVDSDQFFFYPNRTDTVGATKSMAPNFVAGTSIVLSGISIATTGNPNLASGVDGSYVSADIDWTSPAWGTNFTFGGSYNLTYILQSLAIFSDAKSAGDVFKINNDVTAGVSLVPPKGRWGLRGAWDSYESRQRWG